MYFCTLFISVSEICLLKQQKQNKNQQQPTVSQWWGWVCDQLCSSQVICTSGFLCTHGKEERKCIFNDALNTFYLWLYGVRHWYKTPQIAREKILCHHYIGYSFQIARVLLYTPSHRQDSTYHSLCYTSCGALAGMRNRSVGPPQGIKLTTHLFFDPILLDHSC